MISGSHIQTLVNGSLVIRDVEQEDDGRYMCEASNGVGSPLSTVVKLTVHGKTYSTVRILFYKTKNVWFNYKYISV